MTSASADSEPAALLALATDIARDAGALLRSYADRTDLEVHTKTTATDPVSAADRASEQLISERLRSTRPQDGMVGEEQAGDRTGSSGLRWVVDPLDGTVNFLYGIPQWSVSIAVEDDGGPLCGVVYDPSRDETFTALRGGGAYLDGSRVRLSAQSSVSDALIATGYSYVPEVRLRQADMLADLIATIRDVRRFGSAALDLSWVAAGRCDGYAEFALHRWDYSAGALLVAEAGGDLQAWELQVGGAGYHGICAGSRRVVEHLAGWLGRSGAHRTPLPAFDT